MEWLKWCVRSHKIGLITSVTAVWGLTSRCHSDSVASSTVDFPSATTSATKSSVWPCYDVIRRLCVNSLRLLLTLLFVCHLIVFVLSSILNTRLKKWTWVSSWVTWNFLKWRRNPVVWFIFTLHFFFLQVAGLQVVRGQLWSPAPPSSESWTWVRSSGVIMQRRRWWIFFTVESLSWTLWGQCWFGTGPWWCFPSQSVTWLCCGHTLTVDVQLNGWSAQSRTSIWFWACERHRDAAFKDWNCCLLTTFFSLQVEVILSEGHLVWTVQQQQHIWLL